MTTAGVVIAGSVAAVIVILGIVALVVLRRRSDRVAPASPAGSDAGAALAYDDSGALRLGALAGGRAARRDLAALIRVAEPGDLDRLAEIEAQSDPGLDGSGLGALPSSDLREGQATPSVLLVAGRPPAAFIRIDEVDGRAHVDQLAVLPAVARRGIGQALLDAAIEWATQRGYPAMTLSTFAESRWNERVYRPSGFAPMPVLTPGLLELRDWERAIGLDAVGARVVLRRELSA